MVTKIRVIFLTLVFALFAMANSKKVIYLNYGNNIKYIETTTLNMGGIIIVPERKECKDQRVVDRYNKCRKIIEF